MTSEGPSSPAERRAVEGAMSSLFDAPAVVEHAWSDAWTEADLLPEEVEIVTRAVEKRRREFAGGRACARRALGRVGAPAGPLLRGASREPRWPAGYVGAISHANDLCAAVVARADVFIGLGLDVESHREMSPRVVEMIAREEERRAFATTSWVAREHGPRLVFSAKECVHKATFPETAVMLGFSEVILSFTPETRRDAELARGTFRAEPAPDARPDADVARHLEGRFVLTPSHVLCAAIWRR